jgi:hypothetical protein
MKLTETKTVDYNFTIEDESGTFFEVAAASKEASFEVARHMNKLGTPAEVAKHIRNLANNLVKVASKLEGIK